MKYHHLQMRSALLKLVVFVIIGIHDVSSSSSSENPFAIIENVSPIKPCTICADSTTQAISECSLCAQRICPRCVERRRRTCPPVLAQSTDVHGNNDQIDVLAEALDRGRGVQGKLIDMRVKCPFCNKPSIFVDLNTPAQTPMAAASQNQVIDLTGNDETAVPANVRRWAVGRLRDVAATQSQVTDLTRDDEPASGCEDLL